MKTLLLMTLGSLALAAASHPQPIVVRNVSVFESSGRRFLLDRDVVLSGGRILSVTPSKRVRIPRGALVVDGRDKYLIPGLIDAHAHVTAVLSLAAMTGDEVLPFWLANGVTSIRSTGDNIVGATLVRKFADAHPEIAPRVFTCSPPIGGSPPIHQDVCWVLTDPAKVGPFVDLMARWGVTTLKLYANISPEIGKLVIAEGRRRGLLVTGHLSSYPAPQAIRDGIQALEHIESLSDFLRSDPADRHSIDIDGPKARDLIRLIVDRNVFVDPTLVVFWGTLFFADQPAVYGDPDVLRMPQRLLNYWATDRAMRLGNYSAGPLKVRQKTFRKYQGLVGMLYRANTRILVGSDAPNAQVPPGYSLHHEMELLVESGMSPADVIYACTSRNAESLGQQRNLGSIEPGKAADMVLLNADPLTDIRNTRRISKVIRSGVLLDPTDILKKAASMPVEEGVSR